MADNLGAHSVAGFVESFSGSHVCRFCLGEWSEFQSKVVRSGGFQQRTKAVCAACSDSFVYSESDSLLWWWGTVCTIWKTWSFPCNIGVILQMFYMTFQWNWQCHLMSWSRRNLSLALGTEGLHSSVINHPHSVSSNFATRRSVGSNAHENWCLLRLLPLIIGLKVPEPEPVWKMLRTLEGKKKDFTDLVMSPDHTGESMCYLDSLISERRWRFLEAFPQRLIPKHHFLEHYPQLIREFGPVAALWTKIRS